MAEALDLETVKIEIRALLTSSPFLCSMKTLLSDYKNMCGHELPLFGYSSPAEFLANLKDTVECLGNPCNPTLKLVSSKKSAHIASMVEKQNSRRNQQKPVSIPYMKGNLSSYSSYPIERKKIENSPKKDTKIRDNDDHYFVSSSSRGHVNSGMKKKLKNLIRKYPKGIWCRNLPALFLKTYNFELSFREYGYVSLIEMLSDCPDVAKFKRLGVEDWIVFDSETNEFEEENIVKRWTKENDIEQNLRKMMAETPNEGINLNMFGDIYRILFNDTLDFEFLDFKDLKTMLLAIGETFLKVCTVKNNEMVMPKRENYYSDSDVLKDVDPTITPDSDRFMELFREDVIGPGENVPELVLQELFAIGDTVEVKVKEIRSPTQFYLLLKEFDEVDKAFTMNLQMFYNDNVKKFKMPDATIQPNQLCVAYYTPDVSLHQPEKWYRARIIHVTSGGQVDVNLIDWGKTTRMERTRIRFLHKKFAKFPAQAIVANLWDITTTNSKKTWPVTVRKKFSSMVKGIPLLAEIRGVNFEEPSLSVILHNHLITPYLNINEKLVSDGMARLKSDIQEVENKVNNDFNPVKEENTVIKDLNPVKQENKVIEDLNPVKEENKVIEELSLIKEENKIIQKLNPVKEENKMNQTEDEKNQLSIWGLDHNFDETLHSSTNLDEETKKKINLLAIQMLTMNPNIKEVALLKPELALNIALEMAQAYYVPTLISHTYEAGSTLSTMPQLSNLFCTITQSALTSTITTRDSPIPILSNTATKTILSKQKHTDYDVHFGDDLSFKPNFIEEIKVQNNYFHLIKIETISYCIAEELVRSLTIFNSREIADRVLQKKRLNFKYKIVTNETHPEILKAVKSFSVWKLLTKRKKKKMKIYLLPLQDVISYLNALGCYIKG